MTLYNYNYNENADYELGEMALYNYNSNENADFNSGEMILSNYDFNETANYEPSESEDIYILIPDITSMICDHIITKFYYRKYMLKKKA